MGKTGRQLRASELADALKSLDIDEGVRMESSAENKKLFINRNASGVFVVQVTDFSGYGSDIRYLYSPGEVTKLARQNFKGKFSAWLY